MPRCSPLGRFATERALPNMTRLYVACKSGRFPDDPNPLLAFLCARKNIFLIRITRLNLGACLLVVGYKDKKDLDALVRRGMPYKTIRVFKSGAIRENEKIPLGFLLRAAKNLLGLLSEKKGKVRLYVRAKDLPDDRRAFVEMLKRLQGEHSEFSKVELCLKRPQVVFHIKRAPFENRDGRETLFDGDKQMLLTWIEGRGFTNPKGSAS